MKRALVIAISLTLASSSLSDPCRAQTAHLIADFRGDATLEMLGSSVAIVGDVDGDGRADYLIGASRATVNGLSGAGYATLRSGRDGAEIRRIEGTAPYEGRGVVAALGDVDGDGVPDYSVAAMYVAVGGLPRAGTIAVYSGATGAVLYAIDGFEAGAEFGRSVADLGDVDGDGRSDIAVGVPDHAVGDLPAAGAIRIYSGADGSLIREIDGDRAGTWFGWSIDGTGDMDGDGRGDLIVGESEDAQGIFAGRARVISAWAGVEIFELQARQWGDYFGDAVAALGDVDGDGAPDVAVSAPFASYGSLYSNGAVTVVSGATRSALFTLRGVSSGQHLGQRLAGVGDVDGDGRGDLVANDALYSGRAAARLLRFDQVGFETIPLFASGGGDLDGDGLDDVVIGDPTAGAPANAEHGWLSSAGHVAAIGLTRPDLPVAVDVLPLDCPNRLPSPATGAIEAVIEGQVGLSADAIDGATIRMNGVAPQSVEPGFPDATVTRRSAARDDCGAPAADGVPDLVVRFDLAAVAATLRPNGAGLARLDVTAQSIAGRRIAGTDWIHVPVARLTVSPNPARGGAGAQLTFTMPAGGPAPHLRVYDVAGRLVRDIGLDGSPPGACTVRWDGRAGNGAAAPGGVYFARVESGARVVASARLMLLP